MLIFSRLSSTILADLSSFDLIDKRLKYLFQQVPTLPQHWIKLFQSISEPDLTHLGLISSLLNRFKTNEPTLYEQIKVDRTNDLDFF